MIRTSDEGTSYCAQCEGYAREIERLKLRLDAAEKVCEIADSHQDVIDMAEALEAWRKAAGK